MNLLLIEDNENIATGLIYAFKKNNHQLMFLTNVEDAKKYLQTNTPALIILDVSLPDGNGFDFYENVIKEKKIPVVFLTAKDDENDIVKGLNLGAEDYMTKPFSTKELLARVDKIILRKKLTKSIKVKNITFDFDKMICFRDNEVIELSSLELKIIHLLFNHVGKVVKRATILDRIWDSTGNDVDDHTITVYFKRIREKLGTDIITTVKGLGYRIDEE